MCACLEAQPVQLVLACTCLCVDNALSPTTWCAVSKYSNVRSFRGRHSCAVSLLPCCDVHAVDCIACSEACWSAGGVLLQLAAEQ